MCAAGSIGLAACDELFFGVLANRFEHRESSRASRICRRPQVTCASRHRAGRAWRTRRLGAGHCASAVEIKPAREDRTPLPIAAFRHHRAGRRTTGPHGARSDVVRVRAATRRAAGSDRRVDRALQSPSSTHARCSQLDRQRNPVESTADLHHGTGVVRLRQRDARRHRRRVPRTTLPPRSRSRCASSDGTGHSCSSATPKPSRLVATILHRCRPREDRFDHVGRGVQHVLAIVEDQQSRTAVHGSGDALGDSHARLLGDAQHGRDRFGHRGRISRPRPVRSPNTPSGNPSASRAATSNASRVLPTPPTPVNVTSRCALSAVSSSATFRFAADQAGVGRSEISRNRIDGLQRREVGRAGRRPGPGTPRPAWRCRVTAAAPIDKIDAAEQTRRGAVDQDLSAVACGHHPCGSVEHRAEVVVSAEFGLTGRDAHPHRQLQRPLRVYRGIDGRAATRTPRTSRRRCS